MVTSYYTSCLIKPHPHYTFFPLSTIITGLLVSLKGHKQAFVSYTYTITPAMDSAVRVDWKVLTTEALECQHIYYHQLQQGDTLAAISTKYKKSYAMAVVLVNIDDNLDLPAEFSEGYVKPKKSGMPIILISASSGASLKELLSRHDPGELQAKIESKHQLHVEPLSQDNRGSASPEIIQRAKKSSEMGRHSVEGFKKVTRCMCTCVCVSIYVQHGPFMDFVVACCSSSNTSKLSTSFFPWWVWLVA